MFGWQVDTSLFTMIVRLFLTLITRLDFIRARSLFNSCTLRHYTLQIRNYPITSASHFSDLQKIAIAPGGLPTPPSTCNGALVKKNVHLLSSSHFLLSFSRSHISPMGVPHCTNSHSCRHHPDSSGGGGHASNATVSPATAAKCRSYSQRTVVSLLCSPTAQVSSCVPFLRSSGPALLWGFCVRGSDVGWAGEALTRATARSRCGPA